MDITTIPELGLVMVILVVVAITSASSAYKRAEDISSNQQLIDKNSSIEHSTTIQQMAAEVMIDDTDVTEAIVAVVMGCDTDKLADITVRVVKDGSSIIERKLSKADMTYMKSQVLEIIDQATAAGLVIEEFFSTIKFNIVYIDICVA